MNKFRLGEKIQNGYLSQSRKQLPYQKTHGGMCGVRSSQRLLGKKWPCLVSSISSKDSDHPLKRGGGGKKYKHLSQNCNKYLICTKGNSSRRQQDSPRFTSQFGKNKFDDCQKRCGKACGWGVTTDTISEERSLISDCNLNTNILWPSESSC